MSDSEKPFACPSPGCNMSFTNEDHLTVHKKKHDMVLNLGSNGKNTVFIADQTPTPTRFIRNCEEVGLFQDLQNVNPFEETFRRAVEAGKTGTLAVSDTGMSDDTLHTPHIFPHMTDVSATNDQILSESNVHECSATISITEKTTEHKDSMEMEISTSVKLCTTESQNLIREKLTSCKSNESIPDKNVHQDTNILDTPKIVTTQAVQQLSINGEDVQLLLRTADGKLMQLSAIPLSDTRTTPLNTLNQTRQQTVVIKTDPPLRYTICQDDKKAVPSRLSLAKMKLKQVLTKSTAASENQNQTEKCSEASTKDTSVSSSKKENRKDIGKNPMDQRKKKDLLERNRASSMRARAKRKAWIQQLERTVTNVNETNVALQMEVKALRQEVAKLKTLLLAHKDCPVTKAMQKGNGVVLGPKVIPEIITIPVTTPVTPVKRPAVFPVEVANLPKKKLSIVPAKNPVIFPKLDYTPDASMTTATVVKNIPLKIMDAGHYITDKEETKQFLILQNPQRNAEGVAPRQIIQINPNYEIENAASKTTGS